MAVMKPPAKAWPGRRAMVGIGYLGPLAEQASERDHASGIQKNVR